MTWFLLLCASHTHIELKLFSYKTGWYGLGKKHILIENCSQWISWNLYIWPDRFGLVQYFPICVDELNLFQSPDKLDKMTPKHCTCWELVLTLFSMTVAQHGIQTPHHLLVLLLSLLLSRNQYWPASPSHTLSPRPLIQSFSHILISLTAKFSGILMS